MYILCCLEHNLETQTNTILPTRYPQSLNCIYPRSAVTQDEGEATGNGKGQAEAVDAETGARKEMARRSIAREMVVLIR